jgi:hypothetical protein
MKTIYNSGTCIAHVGTIIIIIIATRRHYDTLYNNGIRGDQLFVHTIRSMIYSERESY